MTGQPDSPAGLSFERDVRPMFREKDRDSMLKAFDLWSSSGLRYAARPQGFIIIGRGSWRHDPCLFTLTLMSSRNALRWLSPSPLRTPGPGQPDPG
jgi:hypothetical protein